MINDLNLGSDGYSVEYTSDALIDYKGVIRADNCPWFFIRKK